MGLDPALEEARRDRQMCATVDDGLKFEPAEPTREYVFSKFSPKASFDARPRL
jgi:hypothetical protein